MKALKYILVLVLLLSLIVPAAFSAEDPALPEFGTLYGDLYVILRDEAGVPILYEYEDLPDANGDPVSCIQPISAVDGLVTIETQDGWEDFPATAGEPFALPSYIDTEGDLVECELTEDMLDWVLPVDFGRLNLGRAPDSVIAHAFDEAINKMNDARGIAIDPAGRLVLTLPDPLDPENLDLNVVKTIDSPAENLALYIKMMLDGHWIIDSLDPVEPGGSPFDDVGNQDDQGNMPDGVGPSTEDRPVLNCWDDNQPSALQYELIALGYGGLCDNSPYFNPDTGLEEPKTGEQLTRDELLLAASLLAAAADKTGSITLDKVVYINSIYGINQIGSIVADEGKTYFNFGEALGEAEPYVRADHYDSRQSGTCDPGWISVIQPELDENDAQVPDHYVTTCMNILGHEFDPDEAEFYQANAVHFVDQVEVYTTVDLEYDFGDNVRGFVQAADDALQVLEYIHNYKVPEDLYPDD